MVSSNNGSFMVKESIEELLPQTRKWQTQGLAYWPLRKAR